jgi:hypothetical protein
MARRLSDVVKSSRAALKDFLPEPAGIPGDQEQTFSDALDMSKDKFTVFSAAVATISLDRARAARQRREQERKRRMKERRRARRMAKGLLDALTTHDYPEVARVRARMHARTHTSGCEQVDRLTTILLKVLIDEAPKDPAWTDEQCQRAARLFYMRGVARAMMASVHLAVHAHERSHTPPHARAPWRTDNTEANKQTNKQPNLTGRRPRDLRAA